MKRGTATTTETRSRRIVSINSAGRSESRKTTVPASSGRNEHSQHLAKYVAQRKQVQKTERVEQFFIAKIFLNFRLQRFDVCQDVSVRDHHTARLGRGARGKNDFQGVLTRKRRRGVRRRIVSRDYSEKGLQRDRRNCPALLLPARVKNKLRINFLRHATRKFRRRGMIDRDDDNASKQAPEKHCDPFRGVFAPQQNGIALC